MAIFDDMDKIQDLMLKNAQLSMANFSGVISNGTVTIDKPQPNLTLDTLKELQIKLVDMCPKLPEIRVSEQATEEVYKFPYSRHRSKRIHKKLCKRFGGQIYRKPCIYRTKDHIFVHPELHKDMMRTITKNMSEQEMRYFNYGLISQPLGQMI